MMVGPGWNAGAVRARLIARRRLGPEGCRALARTASLDEALAQLSSGPYGHDVSPDQDLLEARAAVAATPLWDLRVLGGWLPPAGAELVRIFVGWWEIVNIEEKVAEITGAGPGTFYDLGRLDTAWDRIRDATSLAEIRAGLAASRWSDPGGDDPGHIAVWLRLSWAQRAADEAADLRRLLAGWAALVAARDRLQGAGVSVDAPALPLLGRAWRDVRTLAELRERLPRTASWILEGADDPADLWAAEARWWRELHDLGIDLLRRPGSGSAAVAGAFALLLSDAHAVQGALELVARGGVDEEALDETL